MDPILGVALIDYSTLDFSPIVDEIKAVVVVALPVVVTFIAIRKGYGFLKKQLRGA